jgi:hypothetical protein
MSHADSTHYFVETTDGDEQTKLKAITFIATTGSTHVSGERIITTPDGDVTTALDAGLDLEEAIKEATDTIENGFPLSEEAAIAEKQNKPCESIIGNEALGVQKEVEGLITPVGVTDLGDKNAEQQILHFTADRPRVDGQWAVQGVTTILRDGKVKPNRRELSGRSVLTYINFSPDTINTIGDICLLKDLCL